MGCFAGIVWLYLEKVTERIGFTGGFVGDENAWGISFGLHGEGISVRPLQDFCDLMKQCQEHRDAPLRGGQTP